MRKLVLLKTKSEIEIYFNLEVIIGPRLNNLISREGMWPVHSKQGLLGHKINSLNIMLAHDS